MATEVAGSRASVGMPQLDFATFPHQIFWLIVTLIILFFILSKIALPRIANILAERHSAIGRDLDEAEKLKARAEEAKASFEKALNDAKAEAASILAEGKAKNAQEFEKQKQKADADIAAKSAEAAKAIAEIQEQSKSAIEDVALSTVSAVIEAALNRKIDDKDAIKTAVTAHLKGATS